jgi:hypothetical protein
MEVVMSTGDRRVIKKLLDVSCAVASVMVTGCHNAVTGVCFADARPAMRVSVIDNVTRQSILAGATIIALNADTRDSIRVDSKYRELDVPVALEMKGTFGLVVRRVGYADATRSNISVASDDCGHSKTVKVAIALTPVP